MLAKRPDWNRLFEAALAQDGHFTTKQAAEAGYSPQLLVKYLKNGRIIRARRGIYRIVHFPPSEREDLTTLWLWSEQAAIFSHETALMLNELSDVLPRKVHITLPTAWTRRRLRVPKGVVIHYADVSKSERMEIGPIPVTNARRTLLDCIDARISFEHIDLALRQAVKRKLINPREATSLRARARRS